MRLTLDKKLLLMVTGLTGLVLVTQGILSTSMVLSAFRDNTRARLHGEAAAQAGRIHDRVGQATEDLAVIRAHRAIEAYFTSAAFQDEEGVTEGIAQMELFLGKVAAAKPRYVHLVWFDARGDAILRMVGGKRSEQKEEGGADKALLARFDKDRAALVHAVRREGEKWILVTAGALEVDGRLEGGFRMHQVLTDELNAMLSDLDRAGIQGVVADREGTVIANTTSVGAEEARRLAADETPEERVLVRRELNDPPWSVILAMAPAGASAVVGRLAMAGGFFALLLVLAVNAYIRLAIIRRLRRVEEGVRKMTAGDLVGRIPLADRPDEIDDMAGFINNLADSLASTLLSIRTQSASVNAFIQEILKIRATLGEDSEKVQAIAMEIARENGRLYQEIGSISGGVGQAAENVAEVSHASEEVSQAIAVMATASEQASSNVTTVAAAAEEMTANINEVNHSLENATRALSHVAREIQGITASLGAVRTRAVGASARSTEADRHAQGSLATMDRLSNAALQIGQIVDIINNIADQTNMLALNAAIEAAGAGSAGKGFAVVASEIKTLARQTAQATGQISQQIEEIQGQTRVAGETIREVTANIRAISEANVEIARAVADQNDSIGKVSDSMQAVEREAGNVIQNARQLGDAAFEVARAASEAAQGNREIAVSATQAAASSRAMADRIGEARTFVGGIRASSETTTQVADAFNRQTDESLRLVRFLHGSVNHFHTLGDVASGIADSLLATQSVFEIGPRPFDLFHVKQVHLNLLGTLQQVLSGRLQLNPDQVAHPERCPLGAWLVGEESARWHDLPLFLSIQSEHDQIHGAARMVVEKVKAGRHQEAEEVMGSFQQLRRALFDRLDLLYQGETGEEA